MKNKLRLRYLLAVCLFSVPVKNAYAITKPTTDVTISANLDPTAEIESLPRDNLNLMDVFYASAFDIPVRTFNSAGLVSFIYLYFLHTDTTTWEVRAYNYPRRHDDEIVPPVLIGWKTFKTESSKGEETKVQFTLTPEWGVPIKFALNLTSSSAYRSLYKVSITPESPAKDCAESESTLPKRISSWTTGLIETNPSCTGKAETFVVTSQDLADRAIQAGQCFQQGKVSAKKCRQCFDQASLPLRQKFDGVLFRGMLARAYENIKRQRNTFCGNNKS